MIAFLLGLQGGYTKHSCFLCLWDSRADEQHYVVKNWPPREDHTKLPQRFKLISYRKEQNFTSSIAY